jgi:seryl-tRNA synthetase
MKEYILNTPNDFLNELNAKNQIKELVNEVNDLKKKYKKLKKSHNELQNKVETLNKLVKDNTAKEKISEPQRIRDDILIDKLIKGEDTCNTDLHDIEVRWD